MAETLHILNGDGTHYVFARSGIPGDTLIWREGLAEGTQTEFSLQHEFSFYNRAAYWITALPGENGDGYLENFIGELNKLDELGPWDEIVLWFEYDLFCQVNMTACLSWLKEKLESNMPVISLICPGSFPGRPEFGGLGELAPDELKSLWPDRQPLGLRHLEQAEVVWRAWRNGIPPALQAAVEQLDPFIFPHWPEALAQHWLRFPEYSWHPNEIEKELLSHCDGSKTQQEIVGKMLKKNKKLGFGDLWYFNMFRRWKRLLENEDPPVLNIVGQETVFEHKKMDPYWFFSEEHYDSDWGMAQMGGFQLRRWRRNRMTGELIPPETEK